MERARFRSLDVFRGMAICLMIIVNTPGAGSEPWPVLDHADWFGFTAADIVFPAFLFAVGHAMAFGRLKAMNKTGKHRHAVQIGGVHFAPRNVAR